MRPVKLSFCGINFDKLSAGGLFGIFGDTGSGKSTILDCINFALYGNVDRSKKKTDIINYNCEQAEVEYDFTLLSDGRRKKYRVERSIKKKNGLGKAMLYVDDGDGKLQCIADNTTSVNAKVEEILGLNAEDFRKCIALPQGEFAQFVQCAPSERFKIIERLFSLNRYGDGLRENIAIREGEVEAEYLTASGELSAYAEITDESLEECKNNFDSCQKDLKQAEEDYADLKVKSENANALLKSKTELLNARGELDKYLQQSEKMEALRILLQRAPGCERVCEINSRLASMRARLDKERAATDECRAKCDALEANYEKTEKQLADGNFEEKISEIKVKIAAFEAARADISELAETDKDLRVLRDKYRTAVLNCDKLRDEQYAALKQAEYVKNKLDECKVEDLSEILEEKLKPAILRGEYTEQLVYAGDLRESIKGYDDNSELYKFLREELTARISLYEQKIREIHSEKVDIDKVINDFKKKSATREGLLKDYNDKCARLADCKKNCAIADSEAENFKRKGEELKARFNKIKEKLEGIFGQGTTDYGQAVKDLKTGCDKLTAERDRLQKVCGDIKAEIDGVKMRMGQSAAMADALSGDIKDLGEKLDKSLKESGYAEVSECEEVVNTVRSHGDAQKELAAYDGKIVALNEKISSLSAVKGIESVSVEEVEKIITDFSAAERAVKEKHAAFRLSEEAYKRQEAMLTKKKQGEKALAAISKRRELVLQLKELTRGNKFLEYIAGEYLAEVSKAASVTLLKLTGGRYFLTYDDNFYVGDNYNEGNKRGVNTLSGGETFLVSLSLALALSSAICKGSLKSIEFFFLDEGFGTLDESLVDTVMDSLEKLRSADFTIGIISHVEELKHRIENKIIVDKATETHGSTISVYA